MYGHPGKKLMFMGNEFGRWPEGSHARSLDWHLLDDPAHAALRKYVQDLNWHYHAQPSLHQCDFDPGGFRWIDCNDNENSVVSIVRYAQDRRDFMVMVFNFTPVPRAEYRIGVPEAGWDAERPNSDSTIYGGRNVGNGGGGRAQPGPGHRLRHSGPPVGAA